MILKGEMKDEKMNSFSSHFQTIIKHKFPLYFLYELLMPLRRKASKVRMVRAFHHNLYKGTKKGRRSTHKKNLGYNPKPMTSTRSD